MSEENNDTNTELSIDDIIHDMKLLSKRYNKLVLKAERAQKTNAAVKRYIATSRVLEVYYETLLRLGHDLTAAVLKERGLS